MQYYAICNLQEVLGKIRVRRHGYPSVVAGDTEKISTAVHTDEVDLVEK